jgi:hypothetical protein
VGASPPLLDLGAARRIVQKQVGDRTQVIACWQQPEGIYHSGFDEDKDESNDNFYFAVVETAPRFIGGTRHVAVDRHTGVIRELGSIGE